MADQKGFDEMRAALLTIYSGLVKGHIKDWSMVKIGSGGAEAKIETGRDIVRSALVAAGINIALLDDYEKRTSKPRKRA